MKKVKEYRVGGGSDLNHDGGWLKIKVTKYENQTFVSFYLGDDGRWKSSPLFTCDSHWIEEIIFALQHLNLD